ncbi:MAG: response regulator [Anaerolineae bacterium]|nr:response regulator [Anaerolineae bacterium]
MAHILVIEDEQFLLRDFMELLEFSDFNVLGATSGEQGLELAIKHHPDLILCDIGLRSDLNGYQVLEMVRNTMPINSIPFVFMSARADPDSRALGLEKGANDYLTKPFAAADLIDTVTRLLQKTS